MTKQTDTEVTEDKAKDLAACERPKGVQELDGGRFAYYPHHEIKCEGKKIDYFQVRQPNLRQMKAAKLSVGETMNAYQMECMIFACCELVTDRDGGEFMSARRRDIISELFCADVTALTAECSKRFFDTATD